MPIPLFLKSGSRLHMIGIGGIGMSALARILLSRKLKISGSDATPSALINNLQKEGILFKGKHQKNNISKNIDYVIYSTAINLSNPELVQAKKLEIPTYTYAQFLGKISQKYTTIAICGTHGKSTITAMLGKCLQDCDSSPTVVVGTLVNQFNHRNILIGKSDYFVVEACEYRRAFLNLEPKIVILNNIDLDHLDYFKNQRDYNMAFAEFIAKIPKGGILIANYDDPRVQKLSKNLSSKLVTYGSLSKKTDYILRDKEIWHHRKKIADLKLLLYGSHNYLNATSVVALTQTLGLNLSKVIQSLNSFSGSSRRFEFKGCFHGAEIYDDYAHHPSEIQATLRAARDKFGQKRKIWVCFQPHQYHRTKIFFCQFANAFSLADSVIIPNLYKVRENIPENQKISAFSLVRAIQKNHPHAHYGEGIAKTIQFLKNNLKKGHICIIMGAGDVWKISAALLKNND